MRLEKGWHSKYSTYARWEELVRAGDSEYVSKRKHDRKLVEENKY